jgi:hypothetical protein
MPVCEVHAFMRGSIEIFFPCTVLYLLFAYRIQDEEGRNSSLCWIWIPIFNADNKQTMKELLFQKFRILFRKNNENSQHYSFLDLFKYYIYYIGKSAGRDDFINDNRTTEVIWFDVLSSFVRIFGYIFYSRSRNISIGYLIMSIHAIGLPYKIQSRLMQSSRLLFGRFLVQISARGTGYAMLFLC